MKIFIKRSQPFPSFHTIHNDLNLKEIDLDYSAARDRPPCSTSCTQEEGALCSSYCLCAHCSRNYRVFQRPVPLLTPPPTMVAKATVRARGRGKARTMTPATTVATIAGAPRCDPPSTIPRLRSSCCGQGCVLHSSSQHVHRSTSWLLHWRTMVLPAALPSRPCQCLHRISNRARPLPGRPRRACGITSHWPTPSTPWP
jgi:hypothetical protein